MPYFRLSGCSLIQHNTSGFVTYGDKDIHSPKDFEGKTYAGWGGPGEEAVLKAVMAKDGGDFSKLDMVISDGSGFEALKDKVDVMWFFEGWDNIKCRLNDFPINYMELRQLDKRLDYYTPVIIASEDTLKNKPEPDKEKEAKALPVLAQGQSCEVVTAGIKEGKTTPPAHFTEDSLLAAMETAGAGEMPEDAERKGLGTPATRAGILEKLVSTGFWSAKRARKPCSSCHPMTRYPLSPCCRSSCNRPF